MLRLGFLFSCNDVFLSHTFFTPSKILLCKVVNRMIPTQSSKIPTDTTTETHTGVEPSTTSTFIPNYELTRLRGTNMNAR